MNLLKILKSLLSFLGLRTIGWYPVTVNQDYINSNSLYSDLLYSDKYYDFSNDVSQGYWIPAYFNCDKIRFKCDSNLTFKATTFKNFSTDNCPTNYEHNINLPYYFYNNKFAISHYLTEGSVWDINIVGNGIFSVVNVTQDEFYKYFHRDDYIRNIIHNNGFAITQNYKNKWVAPKDDTYVIVISRMNKYDKTILNMKYHFNSNVQCIVPNQEETVSCNADGKMSNNLTYPDDTSGLLFYQKSCNKMLHSESFECIRND